MKLRRGDTVLRLKTKQKGFIVFESPFYQGFVSFDKIPRLERKAYPVLTEKNFVSCRSILIERV